LAEGFKLEFQTLVNQINSLSWNCQHVSFESEFERYRHEMDRRMKLMMQYADSNRAVVEYYPKKTIATAKRGITATTKKCQKVLDHIDEWRSTGLQVAMLSNRKNHTSLEIALAKDERRTKNYENLTAEYKKGKDLEKAMRKKPEPISINLSNVNGSLKSAASVKSHDNSHESSRDNSSEDSEDSQEYNEVDSGDDVVKIDWKKAFHHKQRKTTAWDVIASGEYRVSHYFDSNAPKKDKKILDSVLVFDGKDVTMYKTWKESVSMAICANMSLPFDEKLFKLRSKLKGVPLGYVETYQLSGINFSRALRELDRLYLENSDDQDALFEKLNSLKPVDLYNYDSIQEVLLTIRRIDNHCGAHKKNKAGEISMYTGIKKTPATTAAIRLFCDIRKIKKPTLALFKLWAADQSDALQANRHDLMVKNEKSITKPDSLGVRQSTVNHVARGDGGGEDEGNSSAYEELEAEWRGCGGGMSTGSVVTVMFIGDPGSKESIFAYCFTCNESDHRVLKCKEFLAMEVV
jgi:hypothetical protein